MFNIQFEWDYNKDHINRIKHKVAFKEASSVFYDIDALEDYDQEKDGEDRYLLLGKSNNGRILVIAFCLRGFLENSIRIISARKATAYEVKQYVNRGGKYV